MEASSQCGVPTRMGPVGVGRHRGLLVGDSLTSPPALPLASGGDPQPLGRRVIISSTVERCGQTLGL